jgi:hypothetical protein
MRFTGSGALPTIIVAVLLAFAVPIGASAPGKKAAQTAGVRDSAMGPYQALAELILAAFERGDMVGAAKLARILERCWDNGEENGSETAFATTNNEAFEQIDHAMDAFVKPLIAFKVHPSDAPAVRAAYQAYMQKLAQGDR